MNTKILEKLGLTNGEIRAYLALLKLGLSSTGPLEKKSQVTRSKLYTILDKLEKKGLASHVEKNGVTYFQAVEPLKIKDYLKEKENDLQKLSKEFDGFLPQLQAYHNQQSVVPRVVVYQGMKGLKVAHEHTYMKLKKGEEYCYLGVPAYQPEEHHRYWKKDHERRAKLGIYCRMLYNHDTDSEVLKNRNSYPLADARYMPTDIKTPAEFLIYKDTVMIATVTTEPVVVEIVSQEIADSFKAYFEAFWKRAKKFKVRG